ncbi:MAG: hypothetical protein ACPGGK_14760, partial [Pikeienuella sp.]
ALKDGWGAPSEYNEELEADFFGCLQDGMKSFGLLENGKLGPLDPKANAFFKDISTTGDFVEPDRYDGFVLTGMRFFPSGLIQNYAKFATPSSNNEASAHQFVSDATIELALWDELKGSMMMHTARTLRAHSDAPIFIVWQPFMSESLTEIEWRAAQYRPIVENGGGPFIRTIIAKIDARLEALGFVVLQQPQKTIKDDVMTHREYSEGSRKFRLDGGTEHRPLDVFHMNATFGRLCWATWLSEEGILRGVVLSAATP